VTSERGNGEGPLDPRLLLLDPRDNVVVARERIAAGMAVAVAGSKIVQPRDIPIGHKLACRPIAAGAKVMKYGAPIGSATADIAPGAHVHTHNMKSDYTPTYTLETARRRHGDTP
jgi:hypothetical protein